MSSCQHCTHALVQREEYTVLDASSVNLTPRTYSGLRMGTGAVGGPDQIQILILAVGPTLTSRRAIRTQREKHFATACKQGCALVSGWLQDARFFSRRTRVASLSNITWTRCFHSALKQQQREEHIIAICPI